MGYKSYDNDTLKKLRKVEMEILDEIVRICKENDIEYFLTGGTLLGAVRHKGYIPWDDDIDIGMLRKDYDKFINVCKTALDKKYFLDCFETNKEYYLPFAKIKKNNTLFDEELTHHLSNHKGIYVDIIPFENERKSESITQDIQAVLVKNIIETMFVKKKIKTIKQIRHPFIVRCLKIFSCKFLMGFQKKIMTMCKNNNTLYVCPVCGSYSHKKETMKRNVFVPTKEIKFENKVYSGMSDPATYLSRVFGNYMEFPPLEKRVNHTPLSISFDISKGSD